MDLQTILLNSLYVLGILFIFLLSLSFILAGKDMISAHIAKSKARKDELNR